VRRLTKLKINSASFSGTKGIRKKQMGIFSKINKIIITYINNRSEKNTLTKIEVSDKYLLVAYNHNTLVHLPWINLKRVVAIRRDLYAGKEISVLLEFLDSGVVEISESCDGWVDICTFIEKFDGAQQFRTWYLQMIAAPIDSTMTIWVHK